MLLVVCLALTWLNYGNASLASLARHLLDRLQLVLNAAAHVIFSVCKCDRVSPLLEELHWLRMPQRIEFKLVYRCLHGLTRSYLAERRLPSCSRCRCDGACSQHQRLHCFFQRRIFPLLATARSMWLLCEHGTEACLLLFFYEIFLDSMLATHRIGEQKCSCLCLQSASCAHNVASEVVETFCIFVQIQYC